MFLASMRDGTGWHELINETGNRYGRLHVEGFAEIRIDGRGKRRAYWYVCCDCKNRRVVAGTSLRYGITKSCGCLRNEKALARITEYNKVHPPKPKPPKVPGVSGRRKTPQARGANGKFCRN